MTLIKKAFELLKTNEFVQVATADEQGKPNSAPKLLLKTMVRNPRRNKTGE